MLNSAIGLISGAILGAALTYEIMATGKGNSGALAFVLFGLTPYTFIPMVLGVIGSDYSDLLNPILVVAASAIANGLLAGKMGNKTYGITNLPFLVLPVLYYFNVDLASL